MAVDWIGPAALLLLLLGVACPGTRAGETSVYRRQLGSAIDMPLDADVFRPPTGYNAPEQVTWTLANLFDDVVLFRPCPILRSSPACVWFVCWLVTAA